VRDLRCRNQCHGMRRALLGALAVLGTLLLGCRHTPPFVDARGRTIVGSVATMERVVIGGVEQSVWVRGLSDRAPVLVLLHGGPGAGEGALFRHYNAQLERHFVVVYWEQRGAGRSYDAAMPASAMTVRRFADDLDELVDLLRARFGVRRVALLGHSWGSAIGLLYARDHPDKVSVCAGTGQVADMVEGERRSYAFAVAEAARRRDRRAAAALRRIGPPPHSVKAMLESRKWCDRFGGSFYRRRMSTGTLICAALSEPEVNLWDLVLFGRGNAFSLRALWPEFSRLRLIDAVRRVDVPVVFILGRHDRQVPSDLAAEYFRELSAPTKTLVWMERSGHNPPFEEPAAFNRAMIEHVLPHARAGDARGALTGRNEVGHGTVTR
jgi:proline iminopeptidase